MLISTHAQAMWDVIVDLTTASFFDGNSLYELHDSNRSMFVGYVIGVHDASKARLTFCSPANAKASQVGDVVAKYLRENPERRANQAHGLVRDALVTAWPCPKPPPPKTKKK
jgi:hypothetical protein